MEEDAPGELQAGEDPAPMLPAQGLSPPAWLHQ